VDRLLHRRADALPIGATVGRLSNQREIGLGPVQVPALHQAVQVADHFGERRANRAGETL
jgi:hypothetical protein